MQKPIVCAADAVREATDCAQQTDCEQYACAVRMLQVQLEERRAALRQHDD